MTNTCRNGHPQEGPQDRTSDGRGCVHCRRASQLKYLAKNREARRQMKELQAKLQELGIAV